MAKSLHQIVRDKALRGIVRPADLKPNQREIAKRLIAEGDLIESRCKTGFVLNSISRKNN